MREAPAEMVGGHSGRNPGGENYAVPGGDQRGVQSGTSNDQELTRANLAPRVPDGRNHLIVVVEPGGEEATSQYLSTYA